MQGEHTAQYAKQYSQLCCSDVIIMKINKSKNEMGSIGDGGKAAFGRVETGL